MVFVTRRLEKNGQQTPQPITHLTTVSLLQIDTYMQEGLRTGDLSVSGRLVV
jgi:hypothetical protein